MKPAFTTFALVAVFLLSLGIGGAGAWMMQAAPARIAVAPTDDCAASARALDCACAAERTRHILDAATPRGLGIRYASPWDLAEAQLPQACKRRF